MANRIPLVVVSSEQLVKELPAADDLDLANSSIVNANTITATNYITAPEYFGSNNQYYLIPDSTSYLKSAYFTDTATVSGYVQIGETYVYAQRGSSANSFEIRTDGNSYFNRGTGNVGIGISTPNTKLHVNGTITLQEVKERVNVSATAMGANLTINVLEGAVMFLTANATANSTVNFQGNSSLALNSFMATGQSLSTAILITNGATAFRIANVQIDGTTVTPRWSGGSAPTASANSVDTYAFTIIKTGSATYTVLGSKTQFA